MYQYVPKNSQVDVRMHVAAVLERLGNDTIVAVRRKTSKSTKMLTVLDWKKKSLSVKNDEQSSLYHD